MAIVIKKFYANQPAASAVLLYTCPTGKAARILKCTVCNDTTTNMTFKIYKVPSGQSVGDEYLILQDHNLGSKETYTCPEVVGQILDAGDMIYCHPSAANQLSTILDGVEEDL